MARHICTPGPIQFTNIYPSTTTTTTTSKSHKRVHSSSQHAFEPPTKRPFQFPHPSTTSSPSMSPISSPSTSPTPTYIYIVTSTVTPIGPFPSPVEQNHGVFTQLSDANAKVSRLRTSSSFSREALRGYKAEVVDGALSWSVAWGGMRWEGVEVGVRRVEVLSQWGTELEGLSLGRLERDGEDEVMN